MNTWSVQTYGDHTRPAVVLLHAIATSGAIWSAQIAVWAEQFFVIVIDLPGHGSSAADPALKCMDDYVDGVAKVLDRLSIERAALAGISLGGMIAQCFALRHANRITALVLAQTLPRVLAAAQGAWQQRIEAAQQQGMVAQAPATLQRWFTAGFITRAPLTVHWVAQQIGSTSVAGYIDAIKVIQQFDVLERLRDIDTPTLVVAGAADQAASPEVARLMISRLPHARLIVIDDAAHLANIEQPLQFTEMVGAFLHEVLIEKTMAPRLTAAGHTA